MEKAPVVGIDLGTCSSSIGVFINGKVEIIPIDLGEKTLSSTVSFTNTERLIGKKAKDQISKNPLNSIFAAKRFIGHKFTDKELQQDMNYYPFKILKEHNSERPKFQITYKNQERLFYSEEILAMILQKIRHSASAYLGKIIKDAVITVPNYFNHLQRQSIREAGTLSGLNVLRIMNDTSAVALTFGINRIEKNEEKNIFIFDQGGGHLSVSILTLEENLYEVKCLNGNAHLGGEDLDNRLVDYCINEFRKKTSININNIENPKAYQRIKTACEKAKIALSSSDQVYIDIDHLIGDEDFNIIITRDKFEY